MTDAWTTLLTAADWSRPTLCAELTQDWPVGRIEQFERLGLISEIAPFAAVACADCGGEFRDVVWADSLVAGRCVAYVQCPECGLYQVPADTLRRWSVEWGAVLEHLRSALGVRGRCEELVPQRLWRLGKVDWTPAPATVFCGRRLQHRDAAEILERVDPIATAILLTPCGVPRVCTAVPVVPLDLVCHWDGASLTVDRDYVSAHLRPTATEPISRPPRKRGTRTALIERLTQELSEHVRAARDHAVATLERGGAPVLLPRPTRRELARRCGAPEVAVGRCLRDEAARELRFLWALAADLDRLLDRAPLPN